jgi:hypothetical protein
LEAADVTRPRNSARALLLAWTLAAAQCIGQGAIAGPARGPVLPEIRITQESGVPACVTPERLMRYLADHNPNLDARYRDIARLYKQHGEALGIRWDYAFFQMQLETNHLTFRRGNGDPGDVRAKQNNFAGIGATGGGVPGDAFPDIATGVLAQMQHLLAYAGERIEAPVATRTRERQGDIIDESRALHRPVRFSDLTNRWAADRSYSKSIEVIATGFEQAYCSPGSDRNAPEQNAAADMWRTELAPTASGAKRDPTAALASRATKPETCDVWAASYGGTAALLIRSVDGATVKYTVLQVESGQEQAQATAFIAEHARGGQAISRFASRDQALARAFELCPGPS